MAEDLLLTSNHPPLASDTRQRLRTQLRERRRALPAGERIAASLALALQLKGLPELAARGYVAGYWSVDAEISLHALLLSEHGFVYCLPRVTDEGRLRFAPWRPGDSVEPNRFGIPEPTHELESCLQPSQLQAALVPLVGFDRRGHRLGSGGGFYDRSFEFLREQEDHPSTRLIGVGYALQEVERIDEEAWDVRLHRVVTEREVIRCPR
jgi:5-formyltetrahydrofolate cyclo-ligase